jgi:hypothetical protein
MKKKQNKILKKLESISDDVEKIKKKSVELWSEVKKTNLECENKLRPFEDILLSKLLTDLRIIQNEHISALKVLAKDYDNAK